MESKVWHKWTRNRLTDIENRLVVAKGEKVRKEWESGVSRCKLLYTGWIKNKVLLYRTGNYIQYISIYITLHVPQDLVTDAPGLNYHWMTQHIVAGLGVAVMDFVFHSPQERRVSKMSFCKTSNNYSLRLGFYEKQIEDGIHQVIHQEMWGVIIPERMTSVNRWQEYQQVRPQIGNKMLDCNSVQRTEQRGRWIGNTEGQENYPERVCVRRIHVKFQLLYSKSSWWYHLEKRPRDNSDQEVVKRKLTSSWAIF